MASIGKQGGQRGNLTPASGRKERSETSASHTGSRVEPSHEVERMRDTRDKKTAAKTAVAAKGAKPKPATAAKSNPPRPGTAAMKPKRTAAR